MLLIVSKALFFTSQYTSFCLSVDPVLRTDTGLDMTDLYIDSVPGVVF